MGESSKARGQRLRLTCTECYRRKIKGYAYLCTREDDGLAIIVNTHADGESTASHDLVRTLLDRVSQLEAQLSGHEKGARINSSASPHQPSPHTLQIPDQLEQNSTPAHGRARPQHVTNSPVHEALGSVAPDNEHAATVLEFLAWGRSKDVEYGTMPQQPSQLLLIQENDYSVTNAIFESSKHAALDLLETLLPDRTQIRQLVSYHDTYILWYHGSYSSWIFNNDLNKFLDSYRRSVRHPDLDVQWLALLFAILTGSLACAPPDIRRSWGFMDTESSTLALHWYESSVLCLNTGHYIERHTVHSVEAIATLTIAAHILGRSSSQSVLLSSAGRIAQSLGLHRLSTETKPVSIEQLRQREAGRRVFNQLCTQDWFQIPFSESYSLNPCFITTDKPMNCNDDDLECQPHSVPTQSSYCNYRYEIAALMPRLLDATSGCNTLFTRYEQVLKYDEKMRKLATASMPTFLFTNATIDATWPVWVGWARRSLAICAAHKIIMIHRRFLGLSFTNTAFSFTRRTCVAAANTILKEALSTNDQNGPVLWIEQAFSVAAGIVLSLDTAHRDPKEDDLEQYTAMMNNTIDYLKKFQGSKIAARGAQLLATLQKEVRQGSFRGLGKRHRDVGETDYFRPAKITRMSTQIHDTSRPAQPDLTVESTVHTITRLGASPEDNRWDASFHHFPVDVTLEPQELFDDLLSFQF
ncbi:hypothetical protein BU25DRAFT_353134 [Macroventuria anomochaeta]|uniref:Uncharacterized protein n=1 Tax=Macroventuria anomochaeta TaxID=301207 RepID=A0ACB6RK55_9PLEO|nr:uncharacterized protein BU25DRAFT_353134 [Macroventuria anomochaeta]KAF2622082.1 hypothetical protein BU25DRAFT_353134 [Macroventuria anomochaeta]